MLKSRFGIFIVAALLAIGISRPGLAEVFTGKKVNHLLPAFQISARGNCFYFTLQGVTVSNTATNHGPWFAINKTTFDGGYEEVVALLIAAQTTGKLVEVTTTGATACGWAEVSAIEFFP